VRFRTHVGSRPKATPELLARAETIGEKLAGMVPPRRPSR
jgi:hypothetical protein